MPNKTRPQRKKSFRHQAGYHKVLIRDRLGRMAHRWARRVPLATTTTPAPGGAPERSPFWPPFQNGFERGLLRADLAREAASIFVAEAVRLGQIPAEKTVADVAHEDLEALADQSEEFLRTVAEAELGLETDPRFHTYAFYVQLGGIHFALARTGHPSAFDEFEDPDPRRELISRAQARVFNPPFVDADGWVRLYNTGDEPPTTPADALPIHKSAGATQ